MRLRGTHMIPALLAFAAALLPGTPTASAQAAEGRHGLARPVGVWDIWLERPGHAYGGTFAFTRDGEACGVGQAGSEGFWAPLGADRFVYVITAPIHNEQDGSTVRVTITQTATWQGGTYAGEGTNYVHTMEGEQVAAVPASITGDRTSKEATCP